MAETIDTSVKANGRFYQDELVDDAPNPPRIRLLFIEPAEYGVLVQGRLETFDLEDAPPYNALSYSWGDDNASSVITLDKGFQFQVRRNLEDALQRIRGTSDTICIWIDAICINQADNFERSAQVGLMGSIYSNAAAVLVWLGEVRTLPDVAQAMYATAIGLVQQKDKIWWRRLWVVQETVSAKRRPIVLFGPCRLSWESFVNQWRALCESPQQSSDLHANQTDFLHRGLKSLGMLGRLWQTRPEGRVLYRMLIQTRHHVCSDDHDRIYALLYLMTPSERELWPPDYDTPVEDLFAAATVQFMQTSPLGVDALLWYWYRGSKERKHSWWLDFALPLVSNGAPFFCTDRDIAISTAPSIRLEITGDARFLHAVGVRFEQIDFVRPFYTLFEEKTRSFSLKKLIIFFKDIRYREKHNKMEFFKHKRSRLEVARHRKLVTALPPEVMDLRFGFIESLIWIYHTYASELSERMQIALDRLRHISDEVFRPDDVNTPVDRVEAKISQTVQEDLHLIMYRLYALLANYAIIITPSGFIGFCRYHDIAEDIASETRQEFRPPLQNDLIVHIKGGKYPFVLRQCVDKRTFIEALAGIGGEKLYKVRYTIADGCCLPAIMDGQLLRRAKDGLLQEETFVLE